MAIDVDIEIERHVTVACSAADAWALIADIPRSVGQFPKVADLSERGKMKYRWEMEPIGVKGVEHKVVFGCDFYYDEAEGVVGWYPIDSMGNSRITGRVWAYPQTAGTQLGLAVRGTVGEIPAPRVISGMVRPIVVDRFGRLVERYLENMRATLE